MHFLSSQGRSSATGYRVTASVRYVFVPIWVRQPLLLAFMGLFRGVYGKRLRTSPVAFA